MGVHMPERGEVAGQVGIGRRRKPALRVEVAAPKQIARGNHGGAHGPVFVRSLRPSQILVKPQIEAHPDSYYTASASSLTARTRSSGTNGLITTRHQLKADSSSMSGELVRYRSGTRSQNSRKIAGEFVSRMPISESGCSNSAAASARA